MRTRPLLALSLLLAPPVASAEAPAADTPPLAEVVVVGNRADRAQVTGAADVLDRGLLDAAHVLTINEALRKVPGIYARDEEGLGLRPNIGIRGLNPTRSSKVLLLEDGLPLTYGPYGDNATYYHPPVDRFDRIEILKGSGQVLFGPHTVGGVINYITPAPPEDFAARLSVAGGNRAYRELHAEVGDTLGSTGLLLNGTWKQSDGARERTHLEQGDVNLKLVQSFSDTQRLTLRLNHLREDSQVSYSGLTLAEYRANPQGNPFKHDSFELYRDAVSVTHGWDVTPALRLTTSAYYTYFNRDWWRQSSNSSQRPADASDPACGGIANLDTTCGNEGRLRQYSTAGLEPRLAWQGRAGRVDLDVQAGLRLHRETQDRVQVNGDTPDARTAGTGVNAGLREDNARNVRAKSGFVQVAMTLGRLTVVPGLRYEDMTFDRTNRLTGQRAETQLSQAIPGLGLSYKLGTDTTVFAGAHRGFSPPRVEDVVTNAGGTVDLDAELSWNYELGLRTTLRPGLQFEATAFRMDFENQIVPASVAGGAGATLTSAGATLHQGAELLITAGTRELWGTQDDWYARLAWTWLRDAEYLGTRFSSIAGFTTTSVTGNRLPYAAEHGGTLAVGVNTRQGVGALLELAFTDAMYTDDLNTVAITANGQRGRIPGYAVLNTSVTWTVPGRDLDVYLSVKNLLDRAYIADLSRGILPGTPRMAQLGFTARW